MIPALMSLGHRRDTAGGIAALVLCLACGRTPPEEPNALPSGELPSERAARLEREREINAGTPTGRYAVVVATAPADTASFQLRVSTMGRPIAERGADLRAGRLTVPTVRVIRGTQDTLEVLSVPPRWTRLRAPVILEIPGLISELEVVADDPARPLIVAGEQEIDPPERWVGARLALRRQAGKFVPLARAVPLQP